MGLVVSLARDQANLVFCAVTLDALMLQDQLSQHSLQECFLPILIELCVMIHEFAHLREYHGRWSCLHQLHRVFVKVFCALVLVDESDIIFVLNIDFQ